MPSDAVSSSGASGISPDGHYITGNVYVGGKYLGYVWKDGKIYRQLKENNGIAIPYAISPDGEYTTGWVMNNNRQACLWGPDANFTTLSDQQSPFCVGKKFSPDGKKLLYFGGWQTEEEAGGADKVRGAWALYDMETGKKSAILPAGDNDNDDLDFFDISGNGTVMCEDNQLGYIYQNGKGTFAYKYLKEKGVNLADYHVFVNPDSPKDSDGETLYNVTRATSVSVDYHIMGFLFYNDNKDSDGNYAISSQSMIVKFGSPMFSAMPPVSIKAQQLSRLNSVKITWKPNVAATGITGYKVYRDGNKVSSDVVIAEGFVDAGVPVGEHKYEVTAVYGDVESADSETATVKVESQKLSTPTNLFAQQHGYSAAYMEWNNPKLRSAHILQPRQRQPRDIRSVVRRRELRDSHRFRRSYAQRIQGTEAHIRRFYPMEAQGGWTINLYTRSTDGKLQKFYTQPVTQRLNYGERNVVKLDTPQNLLSGELLVSVEVKVTEASQRITALDFGRAVKSSSDLLRLTTEPDFYSMGNLMEESNYLYAASWAIDAIVAPEGADLAKDNVTGYNIYVDGNKVGSSATKNFTVPSLDKGDHALGVSAVYANGSESEQAVAQLAVVPDNSQLQAVKGVAVAPVSASAVKADWAAPVDRDVVQVQYCTGSASTQGVTAPADNNYNIMVGALYPSKTFRGRTGYAIKKARFYPLTDATYTVNVYKNDELISETEVDDYTVGKWNEVELTMPIIIENGSTYRLAIDCYDVTPKEPAIAVDSRDPLEGYSDINSLDGESWSSISSTGVMANWMIGLVLENPKPGTLPIEGYDVFLDNAKKNAAKLTERTYTHDFGTDDKQQHTIRVDVYYTVKSTSVKGGVTNFLIAVAGIDENTIGRIEMRQGENELTVTDEGVTSVELVSAAGAVVAKAEGNTVSLNGLTAGVYVVKAVVAGETVTRKIMITK